MSQQAAEATCFCLHSRDAVAEIAGPAVSGDDDAAAAGNPDYDDHCCDGQSPHDLHSAHTIQLLGSSATV